MKGLGDCGTWDDVRRIARYQKAILLCLLGYLLGGAVVVLGAVNAPPDARSAVFVAGFAVIAVVALAGVVYTYMLASKLYGTPLAVLFSALIVFGCFGLIVLMVINQKAITVLRQNGVRVGFFGARSADMGPEDGPLGF